MSSLTQLRFSAFRSFAAVIVLSQVVAITGCGSSNIPVTGEVSYQDKPLPNVKVILFGKAGTISQGITDESGKFEVSTTGLNDGAPEGDYRVAVMPKLAETRPSTFDYSIPTNTDDNTIPPKKFHNPDTSGVTCTITSGQGPIKIDLK